MNLADFERTRGGAFPRLVARVPDVGGAEEFEITLTGPAALVKRMLADAEIDLTIDSGRSQDQLMSDIESAQAQQRKSMWELAALDDIDGLLKPDPGQPQKKSTVFAAVRPVQGTGTPFAFVVSSFFVPTGVSLFFFGSWVFTAVGAVAPTSGDQDLFLRLFSTTGPSVSSGIAGGTAVDVVAFTMPLFPFVPCFQVRGFSAGVCGAFSAWGV